MGFDIENLGLLFSELLNMRFCKRLPVVNKGVTNYLDASLIFVFLIFIVVYLFCIFLNKYLFILPKHN